MQDFDACARVVAQQMHRVSNTTIDGYIDKEDVAQDLWLAALRAQKKHDGRDDSGYIRTSVRHALATLLGKVHTKKRLPQDCYGRPLRNVAILDASGANDVALLGGEAPEIEERLDQKRIAVRAVADIARALLGDAAAHIVYEALGGQMPRNPYEIPETAESDLPDCHIDGVSPEGYDADEAQCQGCYDKFSCLPGAAKTGKVWKARGAHVWKISDDVEVQAVLAHEMTYDEAIERIGRRQVIVDNGGLVPAELLTRETDGVAPVLTGTKEKAAKAEQVKPKPVKVAKVQKSVPPPPPPIAPPELPEPAAPQGEIVSSKKKAVKKVAAPKPAKAEKATKKASKKSVPPPPPKKASKKAAPKPVKAAKGKKSVPPKPPKPAKAKTPKIPKAPRVPKEARVRKADMVRRAGEIDPRLPVPAEVAPDKLQESLKNISLGRKIEFEVGMSLVRRTRDGVAHTVKIRQNGYEYDGEIYSSLSAAAMHASGTYNRSGNDYFNLMTSRLTEVRDAKGKVIASKNLFSED